MSVATLKDYTSGGALLSIAKATCLIWWKFANDF